MGYKQTQFLYFFRKLSRDEDTKGGLKKRVLAVILAFAIVIVWKEFPIGGALVRDHEEVFLINAFLSFRGQVEPPKDIAIVKIDDESFTKLNLSTRKPFPREKSALALRRILEDEPKLVILDLNAPYEPENEKATQELADAMKLGRTTIAVAPHDDDEGEYVSAPVIRDAAAMEVPMVVDSYRGVTYYITRKHEEGNFSFDQSVPLYHPLSKFVSSNIKLPPKNALINFYGSADTIPAYSFWELFSEKRIIPKGYFKDKIVFVGLATDMLMRGYSPKELINVTAPGNRMYGVEVHATIAGNLLEGSWINRASVNTEALCLLILFFGMILAILFLEPLSAVIIVGGVLVVWLVGSYIALTKFGFFFPGIALACVTIPFILAAVLTAVSTLILRELEENKRMLGIK